MPALIPLWPPLTPKSREWPCYCGVVVKASPDITQWEGKGCLITVDGGWGVVSSAFPCGLSALSPWRRSCYFLLGIKFSACYYALSHSAPAVGLTFDILHSQFTWRPRESGHLGSLPTLALVGVEPQFFLCGLAIVEQFSTTSFLFLPSCPFSRSLAGENRLC